MQITFESNRDKELLSIIETNLTNKSQSNTTKINGLTKFAKDGLEEFISNERNLTDAQKIQAQDVGSKIFNYSFVN